MTISQALALSQRRFKKACISTHQLDSEVLLAHVLQVERSYLFAHPEVLLSKKQSKAFNALLKRRSRRVPVAYLVGHKEFFGHSFFVTPEVLIPRPESELLVERVNEYSAAHPSSKKVLEIGVGSGCIAASLALSNPHLRICGTDISRASLSVARKNASRHGVSKQVRFAYAHLYPKTPKQFDIIVSNPPYLSRLEYLASLKRYPELRAEPKNALIANAKGIEVIKQIISNCTSHLSKNGMLFAEIGSGQRSAIRSMIKKYLPKAHFNFYKDLSGRTRVVQISLNKKL